MTEPAPALPILGYSPPPPNDLADADPHWLAELSRGCLVTLVAAVARGVLELPSPLYVIASIYVPRGPAWVYMLVDALIAAGVLFCNMPRPGVGPVDGGGVSVGDPAGGRARTLAMLGLVGVAAIDLFDLLCDSGSLNHPSGAVIVNAHYAAAVLGLVGMVSFMRVLGLRARQLGLERLAGRLRLASLIYALGFGLTAVLWLGPSVYSRLTGVRFAWPPAIVRLSVPGHIAAVAGLGLLAWSCWSLSAALRRTAAGRRHGPGEA